MGNEERWKGASPDNLGSSEKGQDWKKLDEDLEKKGLKVPTPPGSASGGSSRGSSPPPGAKPRPKVNPFGAARPREEVLQEKGVDFRKVDLELEHKRVQRDETPEEKALKEEVERLRSKLQGGGGSQPAAAKEGEGEDKQENGVHEEKASEDVEAELSKKEKELDDLIRKLDDKVRFSKATDKPVKERDWRDAKAQVPPPAAAPKPSPPKKEADAATPASPSTAKATPPSAADVIKRPAAIDTKKEGAKRDSGALSPSVVKESPKVKPEPVKKAVSAEPTIVKGGFGALQEDDVEDEEETVEEKQGESQEEEPAQKAPEAAGANKGQDDGRGWEQVKGAGKR